MSISETPASIDARIAATDAASSVPPHIQPPIAQVPRPTAEARMPELPISRVCIMRMLILFSTSIAVASSSTIALTCRPRSAAQIGPTFSGPAATPMLTGIASSSSGLSATRRAFSS